MLVPRRVVAALYIDPRGPYPGMQDVECWDEKRDAKLYSGPHPVVAHPPCGPWGQMRHLCTKQDPMCAVEALAAVGRYGGVLEHPAGSKLFHEYGLPRPGCGDELGRSYQVCQVDWGHVARKRTWLYVVGVPHEYVQSRIGERAGTGKATHCISRDACRKSSALLRCSSERGRRTPKLFAEFLVDIARRSSVQQIVMLSSEQARDLGCVGSGWKAFLSVFAEK